MSSRWSGAVSERRARAEQKPLAAFYGDDFTGATDALGQFCRLGLRGILLTQTRGLTQERDLTGAPSGYDVVGIAGVSRALATADMEAEVRPALQFLRDLDPLVVQYKICSTFDSSPLRGSIGRALEIGREVFGPRCIPVLVAQPEFGRFTVFGTHFAADGGRIYRLDRHPTMSTHPATPMREADITRVLAEQTSLSVGLLDIRQLVAAAKGAATTEQIWTAAAAGHDAVIVDTLTDDHLFLAAKTPMEGEDVSGTPQFMVGSGGLSFGLARCFTGEKPMTAALDFGSAQTLVLSGSRSPQTRRQIDTAATRGWHLVVLNPAELAPSDSRRAALSRMVKEVCRGVSAGADLIVHTNTPDAADSSAADPAGHGGDVAAQIGQLFADLLDSVLHSVDVGRVVIAGGDTSGFTVRGLDAYGMEIVGQLAPAGWLCRMRSTAAHLDGLQLILKGGQVGGDDFFLAVRDGRVP